MISSTNSILTALAISDLLTMLVYIPTSIKYYCILEMTTKDAAKCNEADVSRHTYFWTAYVLFYINATVTMHSISIWLTVLLALFRYLYICHNKIGQKVCTMKNTIIAIIITYMFCIFLCIPSYALSKIVQVHLDTSSNNETLYASTATATVTAGASANGDGTNNTNDSFLHFATTSKMLFTATTTPTTATIRPLKLYELTQSDLDKNLNGLIFRITFFTQALCIKLLPCIIIIILSSLLIRSIRIANQTNKRLQSLGRKTKESEKSREHTRTNIMLVLVCVLFFLTEFPQGILAILSIILEAYNFHNNVYMKLGDIMDILALINNAINFILYCLMSRVFRQTFHNIFCMPLCIRYKNIRKSNSLNNNNKNNNKNSKTNRFLSTANTFSHNRRSTNNTTTTTTNNNNPTTVLSNIHNSNYSRLKSFHENTNNNLLIPPNTNTNTNSIISCTSNKQLDNHTETICLLKQQQQQK